MLLKLFDAVVKGGPWALVVLFVVAWLLGDYGFIESQSKKAVELLNKHETQAAASQATQQEILNVLKEQRQIQSQSALLACLRGAKTDLEREECVKRFPIR